MEPLVAARRLSTPTALPLILGGLLVAGLGLSWGSPPARASGRAGAAGRPKPFTFDRFEPKGYAISVYKPKQMKLRATGKTRQGYREFSGRDPVTGTRFTLYARRAARTRAQLEADASRLTGIKAGHFLKLLARGASQGFAWQVGYYGQPKPGFTTSALVLRHAKRPIVYILVVSVSMAMATRYLGEFRKAYSGLKALP